MADPMRIRASAKGDVVTVNLLVSHEMETGQRRDASGKTVPAWFIQTITATHNNRAVFSAQLGPAVSKNPLFRFSFKGGKAGDKLSVTWKDNRNESRTDEATIA